MISFSAGFLYGQDNTVNPESLVLFDDVPQDDETPPALDSADNSTSTWSFVRMLLILVFVLALIFLFFYLLKKITGQQASVGRNIKILDMHTIKGDNSLMLVEAGRQVFLVGSGSSGIRPIGEITDKETIDGLKLEEGIDTGSGGRSFLSLFSRSFRGPGVFESSLEEKAEVSRDHLDKQKERLKNM